MFMNPPQRSPIVVPDDDEDSLNSVGQLFRDAEVLSSQNHCSQSPDLINSNFLAVKVTSPNQTNMGMANQIPPDGSRKTEKQRIGAPPRTTVNEAVTTARQNSDLGTSVQRDRIQVRSSRSLLANVLNLDDDFRASALVPAQQWTEKMPTNLGRVSSYSHHKRFSEFAEPPPYSFEQSGMNSHLGKLKTTALVLSTPQLVEFWLLSPGDGQSGKNPVSFCFISKNWFKIPFGIFLQHSSVGDTVFSLHLVNHSLPRHTKTAEPRSHRKCAFGVTS